MIITVTFHSKERSRKQSLKHYSFSRNQRMSYFERRIDSCFGLLVLPKGISNVIVTTNYSQQSPITRSQRP